MRVLVCGGRNFKDYYRIRDVLARQHSLGPFDSVLHGGASGADMLADKWAKSVGVPTIRCDALWDYWRSQGRPKVAGPHRNEFMLTLKPRLVIAFPGGDGTARMVSLAKTENIPVIEVPT